MPALNSHGHGPAPGPQSSKTSDCLMSGLAQNASPASPWFPAGPSHTPTHADSAGDGNFSRTTSVSEPPASASSAPTSQDPQVKEEAAPAAPLVSVNVEGLIQDVKRRGAEKGRNAEEVEAMARTAARCVRRVMSLHARI